MRLEPNSSPFAQYLDGQISRQTCTDAEIMRVWTFAKQRGAKPAECLRNVLKLSKDWEGK